MFTINLIRFQNRLLLLFWITIVGENLHKILMSIENYSLRTSGKNFGANFRFLFRVRWRRLVLFCFLYSMVSQSGSLELDSTCTLFSSKIKFQGSQPGQSRQVSLFFIAQSFTASISPNFKLKICQKLKISQPNVINCSVLGDFCLANFKFQTEFKFKIR